MPSDELLSAALARMSESSDVDFKTSFDPHALRDWLEIIKDIAAFANSGGGHILVGIADDGTPSGTDVSSLLAVDPADLDNRIYKYTGQHLSGVELLECEKSGFEICAIRILPVHIPIAFTRVPVNTSLRMPRSGQCSRLVLFIFATAPRASPETLMTCETS